MKTKFTPRPRPVKTPWKNSFVDELGVNSYAQYMNQEMVAHLPSKDPKDLLIKAPLISFRRKPNKEDNSKPTRNTYDHKWAMQSAFVQMLLPPPVKSKREELFEKAVKLAKEQAHKTIQQLVNLLWRADAYCRSY